MSQCAPRADFRYSNRSAAAGRLLWLADGWQLVRCRRRGEQSPKPRLAANVDLFRSQCLSSSESLIPKPTIVTANLNGHERLLFQIQERASGDLTFIIKHPLYFRIPEGRSYADEDRIIEEHYSVHGSSDRPYNTIKHTQIRHGGAVRSSRQDTLALKQSTDRGAIVFAARSGGLRHERYIVGPKRKGRILSLGPYDDQFFEPVYMVAVTRRDRGVVDVSDHDMNDTRLDFREFSVILIWQFLAFTDRNSSDVVRPATLPADGATATTDDLEKMQKTSEGLYDDQIAWGFHQLKDVLLTRYYEKAWSAVSPKDKKNSAAFHEIVKDMDVGLKSGVPFSADHIELLAEIKRRMILLGKSPVEPDR